MLTEILHILLRPVTDLLHQLIKETRMNQTETIDALNASSDKLADVDTKIVALAATVDKVGTETTALLAEIQVLKDEVIAAHTTSPALLAAIESISTRATSISGHVAAAATAASAADASVPDKVVPPAIPHDVPPAEIPHEIPTEPAPVVPPVEPPTPVL